MLLVIKSQEIAHMHIYLKNFIAEAQGINQNTLFRKITCYCPRMEQWNMDITLDTPIAEDGVILDICKL
jgi:hypothetical protein